MYFLSNKVKLSLSDEAKVKSLTDNKKVIMNAGQASLRASSLLGQPREDIAPIISRLIESLLAGYRQSCLSV